MFNVAGYAIHAENSFSEKPITTGDAMVFSAIAYTEIDESGIPLPALPVDFVGETCRPVLLACSLSKRFSDIKILKQKTIFSEEPHCQFSGTAIQFDNSIFIAFRGTDETVSGWLEDFDIIAQKEIPSQKYGVEFLTEVAQQYSGMPIYLGGHSKGGNVSVYAAAFCDKSIKPRIKNIYNFDGPGFLPEIRSKQEYKDLLPKVYKLVPQMSFFGMILLGNDPVIPCKCKGFWFLQHDHFAWYIDQSGEMASTKKLSILAKKTQKFFHKVLNTLSTDERKKFVSTAERIIKDAGVTSMYQMSFRSVLKIISFFIRPQDPKERKFVRWLEREVILALAFPIR